MERNIIDYAQAGKPVEACRQVIARCSMDFVSQVEQVPRQIGAILASNSDDEGCPTGHAAGL